MNGSVNEWKVDTERYYRTLRDKRDFAKRQLRDLVKQDREDIEWMWELERNERNRERNEQRDERDQEGHQRTTSKSSPASQKRAADWKRNPRGKKGTIQSNP